MAKRKPARVAASGNGLDAPAPKLRELTYKEERFVDRYIRNGGWAGPAARDAGWSMASAYEIGSRLLRRVEIIDAIAKERERLSKKLAFKREDALEIYVAMATARLGEFTNVLKNPESQKSYRGLGDKEYAIASAKSSAKHGNEIRLVDRKAVVDGLWEKLGLGKESSGGNWFDGLEQLAELVRATKERKQ